LLQPTAYGPGGSGSTTASESARAPGPTHSARKIAAIGAVPRSEKSDFVDFKSCLRIDPVLVDRGAHDTFPRRGQQIHIASA
jgi:hypothetical protein